MAAIDEAWCSRCLKSLDEMRKHGLSIEPCPLSFHRKPHSFHVPVSAIEATLDGIEAPEDASNDAQWDRGFNRGQEVALEQMRRALLGDNNQEDAE